MTVEVWRVEALKGIHAGEGPYHGTPTWADDLTHLERRAIDEAIGPLWSHVDDVHPTPQEDPGIGPDLFSPRAHRCAFRSREQMREWFTPATLAALVATGWFGVVRYVLPDDAVIHGAYQSIFRHGAHLVREVVEAATLEGVLA